MKPRTSILLIVMFLVVGTTGCRMHERHLFRIVQNGLVGYIDSTGKIAIKPVYKNGGEFSEGLAAVRLHGYYGYINDAGNMVIPARYDYAADFQNGIAKVHIDGSASFIDRKGNRVLGDKYKDVDWVDTHWLKVLTKTGKVGVLNVKTSVLLLDTVYSATWYESGVFRTLTADSPYRGMECVIDTLGRMLVSPGTYQKIEEFSNGYAVVRIDDSGTQGVINTRGELLFSKRFPRNCYILGNCGNGLFKMGLYKYWIPEEHGVLSTSEKDYGGYINLKGEIVLNDTTIRYAEDFSCGRAFIQPGFGMGYYMINTKMERVGTDTFSRVQNFVDGYAVVKKGDDYWAIIDTNGDYAGPAEYGYIHGVIGDYIFYANDDYGGRYGIARINDRIIVKVVASSYDKRGFSNALISAMINDRLTYIDTAGNMVWQAKRNDKLQNADIDYMLEGYFRARSCEPSEWNAVIYGAGSDPYEARPEKLKGEKFAPGRLSVVISNEPAAFIDKYNGLHVYVVNRTADTLFFPVQDGRLDMKLQALDKNNKWRDIEHLQQSWCGRSYYTLWLPHGQCWRFTMPKYTGELKTKVRLALVYTEDYKSKNRDTVYSNEVNASVNPAQFWRVQEYHAANLMDPYGL